MESLFWHHSWWEVRRNSSDQVDYHQTTTFWTSSWSLKQKKSFRYHVNITLCSKGDGVSTIPMNELIEQVKQTKVKVVIYFLSYQCIQTNSNPCDHDDQSDLRSWELLLLITHALIIRPPFLFISSFHLYLSLSPPRLSLCVPESSYIISHHSKQTNERLVYHDLKGIYN